MRNSNWIGAVAAGVLWIASGAVNGGMTWNGYLSGSIGAVLPATIPTTVWAQPLPWPLVAAAIGAGAVALAHLATTRAVDRAGTTVVGGWFAAIVAGAVVGLAADLVTILVSLPAPRLQWLLNGLGTQAGLGAYWGLVLGWLPAVLAKRLGSAPAETPTRRFLVPTLAAVLALVAVVAVGVGGYRGAMIAAVQAEAIAGGFDEADGALPDPYAEGTPPPTAAPGEPPADPTLCTSDVSTLLLGGQDAAAGSRSLSITLLNFSDTPCTIEGYIDLAFADQNGSELPVVFEPGSTTMTTDPGVQRIEIPAQGSAVAFLGWKANSTAGALVGSTLFAAPYPSAERGSWPVRTDVVDGSTVSVTAWRLLDPNEELQD
jgi:hypothetical protein